MRRFYVLLIAILFPLPLSGQTNSIDSSKSDTNNDRISAIKIAAGWGDPSAQFDLSDRYFRGDGVDKDPVEGVKWCIKSAQQGDLVAQYNLGVCYQKGIGVSQNMQEAFSWFKKSAEQNFPPSAMKVGTIYFGGNGIEKNIPEAIRWFTKAANLGDAQSQQILSAIYREGIGVPKNPTESFRWGKMSAEQGNSSSEREVGLMYDSGVGVDKNPAEGTKWFLKAAKQGDIVAQRQMGRRYEKGAGGVEQNPSQAMTYYRSAAEQGDSLSQAGIGLLYKAGKGVPKDNIEALAWMNLASVGKDSIPAISQLRDQWEADLGNAVSIAAQQRCKDILASFPAKKAESADGITSSQVIESTTSGSGVALTTDGLILTAYHVVKGAKKITIQTNSEKFSAKVVQIDSANDIALLKCEGSFKACPITSSKDIHLGQSVFTIGYPNINLQGYSPKVTKGEISSMNGIQDDPREWQVSVPIQHGNSGGPLFDDKGNVIGIVVAKLSAAKMAKYTGDIPENVGYAIKSSYILPLLDQYSSKLSSSSSRTADTVDLVHKVGDSVVLILAAGNP